MSVSYLVTLYNKEPFIGNVMDAVLAEHAATGGEIIVYDDVSTDRSPEIVRERLAAHPGQGAQARIVRGEINRGVGFGTNYLIAAATQPYTRLVDADDVLVKGSTAQMMRLMKENDLGFIFGRGVEAGHKDLENQTYAECFMLADPVRTILRHTIAGPSPSVFVTEELKKSAPVPEWIKRTQDFLITLRVANRGVRIGYVKEVVFIVPPAYSSSNLSAALAAMFAEMCRDVAHDGNALRLNDLRYASRRHAGRAAKYFRRRGRSKLSPAEKLDLWRWRNFGRIASRQDCIERLTRTADLLDRDRDVIITGPAR